jgi:hypothetical protein
MTEPRAILAVTPCITSLTRSYEDDATGTTLTADVSIILGGSDHRAELSLPVATFPVQPDSSLRRVIVFELRSQRWLTARALQSGRVEDAELQAAATATTRAESR